MSILKSYKEQMARFGSSVKKAKEWFDDKVSKLTGNQLMRDMNKLTGRQRLDGFNIGRMVMYYYDPKHKETLPYYDRFPLAIIVDIQPDGFTALNLHYLPINIRAQLLDALYKIYKNKHTNEKKKLTLSYDILKGTSRAKMFAPCFKKYLSKHVRSKFYVIPVDEWEMMITLPLERFEKKSKQQVWAESRKKYTNG